MKTAILFCVIGFAAGVSLNNEPEKNPAIPAKTYVVDLDQDPLERWDNLLSHFDPQDVKDAFHALIDLLIPSKFVVLLVETIAANLDDYFPYPFNQELRGVSRALNMDIGDVVLSNVIYDLSAYSRTDMKACTSIIAKDRFNRTVHGRDLDYPYYDLLKPLTVQVDYRKGGKTVFLASTTAGFVGVITGNKPGAFSISGNQRNTGSLFENIASAFKKSWPTFFLSRKVLETAENYRSAVYLLKTSHTIAPVYFLVSGVRPNQAVNIVKDRRSNAGIVRMRKNDWYLVETNYDPWNPPPPYDDRRTPAIEALEALGGKENMDARALYQVLSTPVVFNHRTAYTTVMTTCDASVFHTMIRYDAPLK